MLIDGALADSAITHIDGFTNHRCGRMSYDVTLGDRFMTPRNDVQTVDLSFIPEQEDLFHCVTAPYYWLSPGKFVKAVLAETIRMPEDRVGMFSLTSKIAQCGLDQATSLFIRPGWEGKLILELYNSAPWHLKLCAGQVVGQISFFNGVPQLQQST